jgi:hypothetical protein
MNQKILTSQDHRERHGLCRCIEAGNHGSNLYGARPRRYASRRHLRHPRRSSHRSALDCESGPAQTSIPDLTIPADLFAEQRSHRPHPQCVPAIRIHVCRLPLLHGHHRQGRSGMLVSVSDPILTYPIVWRHLCRGALFGHWRIHHLFVRCSCRLWDPDTGLRKMDAQG